MSKFIEGQRVKVVNDLIDGPPNGQFLDREGVVKQLGRKDWNVLVALDDTVGPLWFDDDELEAV